MKRKPQAPPCLDVENSDPNQALARSLIHLLAAKSELGDWLREHGAGCGCDYCGHFAALIEDRGREVYAAGAAVDQAVMYLTELAELTPEQDATRRFWLGLPADARPKGGAS